MQKILAKGVFYVKKAILIPLIVIAVLLSGCSANTNKNNKENSTETQNQTAQNTTGVENTAPDVTGIDVDISSYNASAITWGPGNIENNQRPKDPTDLQNRFSELSAQWLLDDTKQICLTFDEGYENGYTDQILDTLKEKKVPAIFFCTYDYVSKNPELVQRMIKEGHIVANHSYRHYNMTQIDMETAKDEVTVMHDYMAEYFSYEMKLFRFPEGEFSEQNLALVKSLGYKSVFWSFAYADWDTSNPPDKDFAYNKITSSLHNGEIMLLHAVCQTNADILPSVIDEITKQGYTFTVEI